MINLVIGLSAFYSGFGKFEVHGLLFTPVLVSYYLIFTCVCVASKTVLISFIDKALAAQLSLLLHAIVVIAFHFTESCITLTISIKMPCRHVTQMELAFAEFVILIKVATKLNYFIESVRC